MKNKPVHKKRGSKRGKDIPYKFKLKEQKSAAYKGNSPTVYTKSGLSVIWKNFVGHADHCRQFLSSIVKDSQQRMALLSTLSKSPEHQLPFDYNDTTVFYPKDKTIVALFEEQVERTPEAIAVIFEAEQLTYKVLNEKSNQLAHYLKGKHVMPDALVPVCIERSLEMVVAILGILKSGAAYVPMDPEYPAERIHFMVEDTGATIVVSSKEGRSKLKNLPKVEVIELDTEWINISSRPGVNLKTFVQPHHLAYVIYTSGSTGKPKGVMIEHGGLVASTFSRNDYYSNLGSVLLIPSIAFDSSVAAIFSTFLTGGRLILCRDQQITEAHILHKLLQLTDVILCVPSYYRFVLQEGLMEGSSVSTVILGGEKLDDWLVSEHFRATKNISLYNEYGPTEGTVWSTVAAMESKTDRVTIGKPINSVAVYILNNDRQPVPVGVVGELCIGGVQVARGYLNLSQLTEERFIQNPYSSDGFRMYRTGDLARWLPDGNIDYLGREDDQVKIRGYRIEVGEIENAIRQSRLVRQALVVAKEDAEGCKRLVGYVVPEGTFDREAIVTHLKSKLPDYMLPALWVELELFPLTANGKVNQKALPDPDVAELLRTQYVAPRYEIEEKLSAIWQKLLGVERVGVYDHFFELGGHSLMAMRTISAIRNQLQLELHIKTLFLHPTIKELAVHLGTQIKGLSLSSMTVQPRPEFIPLSFGQQRLWFIDRLEGSTQYQVPVVFRLKGKLNIEALSHSFQNIVNRHEVLRTCIGEKDGRAYQSIKEKDRWQLSKIDCSLLDGADLRKYVQQLTSDPFDLSKDDMLRCSLITLTDQEYLLVVMMHHIAADGWSESLLINELIELYESFEQGRSASLQNLALQYADYAIWQRAQLQGELFDKKISYWRDKLQGVQLLELPADFERPTIVNRKGAVVAFHIHQELVVELRQLCQQQGATLFMTLLAAFKVLLYRYTGQKDICVGCPIANRTQQEIEGLIGFFVNTLALRSELNGNAAFTEFLQQVKDSMIEAYEHQEVPFEKVVEVVMKKRDLSRNPLFQVALVLQNNTPVHQYRLGDVELVAENVEKTTAQFDITFSITETAAGLNGTVEYATELYKEATIIRMIDHFKNLIGSIVKTPQQKIGELVMLSKVEEQQLIYDFNDTTVEYPKDRSIVDLFEEQVAKTPDATAVIFGDFKLSYLQLDQRSNQLAHYLKSRGVKSETLVPICVERSLEMIVGILGILKAGGAYVPVDMKLPEERIKFMLKDTRAVVVVTDKACKLKIQTKEKFVIIELDDSVIKLQPVERLAVPLGADNLAYIIYTSGSTGKPKGVMVEHGNVLSLVKGIDYVSIHQNDILLSTGSFSFDATTFEYWGMLLNGGQLVLCQEITLLNTILLKKEITNRGVTKMWFTSSWFNQIVETDITVFENLQTILVGGEKLSHHHINQVRQKYPFIDIINGYGPTENTTFSSTYKITEKSISSDIPIGRPLSNRRAYVLNEQHQLAPIGSEGEICLGGAGLSRGYLNQAKLTGQKFIADPFSKETGGRLYKTGDLGRWLPDGNIEYLCRMDDQVKIRGYRIEPGEIESVLRQCVLVRQAAVLAKEDAEHNFQLVAYVVPEGTFEREAIVVYLKNKLPDYMVPVRWVNLENFPLTRNGKIDKKALSVFEGNEVSDKKYEAPSNDLEASLAELWKKLLSVEQVGRQDNFFELGGHSLLAMRLISAIRSEQKVEVPLTDIFEATIQSLAIKIRNQQSITKLSPCESQIKNKVSLSLSQAWQITQRVEKGLVEWDLNGIGKYMMPIQKTGAKIPFFGIISYDSFRLLSNFMPKDQPLYYFPPTQSSSVEDIASHYVKEIKLVRPSGPYCIGGFCAAGMIALEIARQLKAQGDEVSALILFEFYSPNSMISRKSLTYKKRRLSYYKDRFISLSKSIQSPFKFLEYIIKKSFERFRNPFGKRPPPKFITSSEYYKYSYKPYSGKVVLFKASIPPLEYNDRPLMGWSDYFTGDVDVISIEGGHLGILREPAVEELAESLNKVLEEVNNRSK